MSDTELELPGWLRRQDQRDDFPRQTLLELQEAIAHFARPVGRSHHHYTTL